MTAFWKIFIQTVKLLNDTQLPSIITTTTFWQQDYYITHLPRTLIFCLALLWAILHSTAKDCCKSLTLLTLPCFHPYTPCYHPASQYSGNSAPSARTPPTLNHYVIFFSSRGQLKSNFPCRGANSFGFLWPELSVLSCSHDIVHPSTLETQLFKIITFLIHQWTRRSLKLDYVLVIFMPSALS